MSRKKPTISDEVMITALEIAVTDLTDTAGSGTFADDVSVGIQAVADELEAKRLRMAKAKESGGGVSDGPSERGLKFADWFRGTLPAGARPVEGWRVSWARCFDDLMRLDERTPEEIWRVCEWARTQKWWKANFLTPLKLRKRDGNQVLYFDAFWAEMLTEVAVNECATVKGREGSATLVVARPVFEEFERGTGISMRVPTDLQVTQAGLFLANFELWELRVTLAWLKAMIARAEGGEKGLGLTRLSAQWQSVFGKEPGALGNFEQRRGLAVAWAVKARPDLLPKGTNPTRKEDARGVQPVSAEEQARLAAQAKALLEGFGKTTEGTDLHRDSGGRAM